MEGKNGAVVALDPRTGEVLAMVSRPAFDPNKFAVRIKSSDWREIADNPDHPLLNRAIQAQQAPGSTFKPFVAIAGLESGAVDDEYTIHCPGGASFYGHYYKCWQKGGHGTISLHNGIVHSCDVYFYNVGNRAGIDKLAFYANQAGMGQKTGIDLPHEAEGVVPSSEWKIRNFRQKWFAGETISVAIGQGALTVTPLQLARAYMWLVNGGLWHQPHLVKGGKYQEHSWPISPDNVQKVIYGTWGVVNEGGTGVRALLPGLDVCGKTGSAQVASNEFTRGKNSQDLKDNAWFVGFAPRQAPEIVVVAFDEHAVHGQFAAPIARDVMKAYFDKKVRLAAEGARGRAGEGAIGAVWPLRVEPATRWAAGKTESPVIEAAFISSGDDEAGVARFRPLCPANEMKRHLGLRRPRLDLLLIISLVICGVGVLQIFSATRGTGWQDAWWKQILYILAGMVLIWLSDCVLIDYHTLMCATSSSCTVCLWWRYSPSCSLLADRRSARAGGSLWPEGFTYRCRNL